MLIILPAAIADGDVEVAVGTELKIAPVVIDPIVLLADEHDLGGGIGDVSIAGRDLKTRNALVQRRARIGDRRIVQKEISVHREVWMKRDTQQTALSREVHMLGNIHHHRAGR